MERTSITASAELLDAFDRTVHRKIADGELPTDTKRTHVIRALMRGYVEGNLNSMPETSPPTSAD